LPNICAKLDSMRWFSHRRSPSPPKPPRNGIVCCRLLLTAYDARPTALSVGMTQKFFLFFFVPGDLDLWPLIPKFELGRDFCTAHLTAKLRHPKFNRSEVIVRTNKQTLWLKVSSSLRYATPVGKYFAAVFRMPLRRRRPYASAYNACTIIRPWLIDWLSRVWRPITKHIIGHIGNGFLRVKWPNQQCQSTEGSNGPEDQASIPPGPPHRVTILHSTHACNVQSDRK